VDGAVKIVSDARYGEILGVHIVGTNATEVIGEAVLAMQLEATVQELSRSIRIHPTFSEALVDAARDVKSWALYFQRLWWMPPGMSKAGRCICLEDSFNLNAYAKDR